MGGRGEAAHREWNPADLASAIQTVLDARFQPGRIEKGTSVYGALDASRFFRGATSEMRGIML